MKKGTDSFPKTLIKSHWSSTLVDPKNISGSSEVASSREHRFECLVHQRYCTATSSRKKPHFYGAIETIPPQGKFPAATQHHKPCTLTFICRKSGQCTSILMHTTDTVLQSPCKPETVPPAISPTLPVAHEISFNHLKLEWSVLTTFLITNSASVAKSA